MQAAESFARATGGQTLEMTRLGRALSLGSSILPRVVTNPLWRRASRRFAEGASGAVNVFHSVNGVRLGSVWRTIEYPILRNNNAIIYRIVP